MMTKTKTPADLLKQAQAELADAQARLLALKGKAGPDAAAARQQVRGEVAQLEAWIDDIEAWIDDLQGDDTVEVFLPNGGRARIRR